MGLGPLPQTKTLDKHPLFGAQEEVSYSVIPQHVSNGKTGKLAGWNVQLKIKIFVDGQIVVEYKFRDPKTYFRWPEAVKRLKNMFEDFAESAKIDFGIDMKTYPKELRHLERGLFK